MKKRNSKCPKGLIDSTLVLPLMIYEHVYSCSIAEYKWRTTVIFSNTGAVTFSAFIVFLLLLWWMYVYCKIYILSLDKISFTALVYLFVNPYWAVFYYLQRMYIEYRTLDDFVLLGAVVLVSTLGLKVYNGLYVSILKKEKERPRS